MWECFKPKLEALQSCDREIYEKLLESATEEELLADLDSSDVYFKRFTE